MAKTGYSEPKLHDCGGDLKKEWYVSFRFTNPDTGERKPFPLRMGINYLKTKQERYDEAAAVISLLKDALRGGWNPYFEDIKVFLQRRTEEDDSIDMDYTMLPFYSALKIGFNARCKAVKQKSASGYKTAYEFALKAAKKIPGFYNMAISKVKRRHIKLLLSQMRADRQAEYDAEGKGKKFTGNNYNKYKRGLSAIFAELVELDALEYNPCEKIKKITEVKTNIHRHATPEEEKEIKQYLKQVKPKFFVFLATETLTGMRPSEILGLRIKDYDKFNQSFIEHETNSKTNIARLVPIPNTLLKYLEMLQLEKYDPEYYIFSEDFEPGPVLWHRNRVTEVWKELIKEELGINVTMYSFKGLGGERKRQAKMSHESVQKSMGHTSAKTTDIYLLSEDERRRQEIIEKTPDF